MRKARIGLWSGGFRDERVLVHVFGLRVQGLGGSSRRGFSYNKRHRDGDVANESGPLRAVNMSRHNWPGALVILDSGRLSESA